ncbi:hypothetical protein DYU05_02565 [Mucilaginibacter terrenus]|uniref:KTSC domain-containing protein n=1 Tax=Mucilaginibacter terrenus TaxID=2482727 RepID=A0A3E2NUI9_9SPHI|nr:hypothetical protein [Mucilaginibacter terrenus]RFZ84520.1 hypothetical protein DYU05_02565 [Mucilaginibacter terrenus]
MAPIKMHPYGKLGHDSGVVAYAFDKTSILLVFRDDHYYLYNSDKPGLQHVKKMIALAKKGEGLSTYISQHEDVRNNYKDRWTKSDFAEDLL